MNILLSAYACKPNKGSEDGLGWNWATNLARSGNNVWVLTREANRAFIESEIGKLDYPDRLHFIYFDLPEYMQWNFWSKFWRTKLGLHVYWHIWHYPYHFFWQYGAYRHIKRTFTKKSFDVAHHITFSTIRRYTFLGGLDIPFIFGPVGGGDRAPMKLRSCFRTRAWIYDFIRDIGIYITKFNPLMWKLYKQAMRIYVTTPSSLALIPRRYQKKAKVKLELGCRPQSGGAFLVHEAKSKSHVKFLYVGRFIYWKGMYYGINAFAKLLESHPSASLTIVGRGLEEEEWRKLSRSLNLEKNINWISWVEQSELSKIYLDHDVLLFPSLHDSGGNVVLEALMHGLPVICLDLGGPAVLVDETCGRIVNTYKKGPDQVIAGLCHYMSELAANSSTIAELSKGAIKKSKQYEWDRVIQDVYKELDPKIRATHSLDGRSSKSNNIRT